MYTVLVENCGHYMEKSRLISGLQSHIQLQMIKHLRIELVQYDCIGEASYMHHRLSVDSQFISSKCKVKQYFWSQHNYYYYYWYSALGLVWVETRAQSGDWYGSGTLHPGQVLRGSLPLLSPGEDNIEMDITGV